MPNSVFRSLNPRPLAACLALALSCTLDSGASARAVPIAPASTLFPSNCEDSGPGSLREAVAEAADEDTVDLGQLPCSSITLSTGEIEVHAHNLTITGPAPGASTAAPLTISAQHISRVFSDSGNDTLTLQRLDIADGQVFVQDGTAAGGCISTPAMSLNLYNVHVRNCVAQAEVSAAGAPADVSARGGAVYADILVLDHSSIEGSFAVTRSGRSAAGGAVAAYGLVELYSSRIENNTALSLYDAIGGGIASSNGLFLTYSTISGNTATSLGSGRLHTSGGGAYVSGRPLQCAASTISDNHTNGYVGGAFATALNATYPLAQRVLDCTISGNSGMVAGGLAFVLESDSTVRLDNSTIVANTSNAAPPNSAVGPGAVLFDALGGQPAIALNSSILAGNRLDSGDNSDIATLGSMTLSGRNNLIQELPAAITTLTNTISGRDPGLGPLADNGGPTPTHLPQAGSPVIDAGIAPADLPIDQRGHARVFGAAADIGAVERDDTIFRNGFN